MDFSFLFLKKHSHTFSLNTYLTHYTFFKQHNYTNFNIWAYGKLDLACEFNETPLRFLSLYMIVLLLNLLCLIVHMDSVCSFLILVHPSHGANIYLATQVNLKRVTKTKVSKNPMNRYDATNLFGINMSHLINQLIFIVKSFSLLKSIKYLT